MQEQLAAPSAGRERWADLQGSVSGMLEEMSSLVRRVDGLEEKLRLRTASCEELVRQKSRELEQQVHSLQQKALLATSTSEEMSKRHTTRLRKLGQVMEEHAQRLSSVEDVVRRPTPASHDTMHVEARLVQLERQLAGHEDDLRSLTQSADARSGEVAATAMLTTDLRQGAGGRCGDEDNFDSMLRGLEREVSNLSQRTSTQLDEHAVALANLRVRSDGQEQRLSAASERLETVVNPPLEALRVEVTQLREHDRLETKAQLEHLSRNIQAVLESSEESAAELRGKLGDLRADLQSLEPRAEDHPAIQKLTDSTSSQEQALRRLEAMVVDMPRHGAGSMSEELCGALLRLDAMEHRVECLEQAGGEDELAEKADRAEVTRIDAALQELSEPLRRLSQRTASSENRTVALERRVEQLQQMQGSQSASLQPQAHDRMEELSAAAVPSMDAIADLTARVVELESLVEHGRSLDASGALPSQPDSDGAAVHALRSHVAELSQQVSQLRSRANDFPSSSGDQADRGSQTLHRLSASEEATRALQQQLHQLESGHRKLEHSAASSSGREDRISALEKASRDVQKHVQEVAARPHDPTHEHRLASLEANSRSFQEDLQELRRQTRELSHSSTLGADHEDRFLGLEKESKASRERVASLEGSVDLFGPQLRELKEGSAELQALVERLRSEQEEKTPAAPAGDDLAGRLTELAQRVEGSEGRLAEVQSQLHEPIKMLEGRLERLSESQAQMDQRQKPDGGLAERVDEAVQSATSSAEAVKALKEQHEEQLRTVRSSLDEPFKALREELEKLGESHAELERRQKGDGDLADRVHDAVQRATSSDKAVKALQEQHEEHARKVQSQLEEPLRALQERLEKLSESHTALEGRRNGEDDASARIEDAIQRIVSSEKAVKALQGQQEEQSEKAAHPELAESVADLARRVAAGEEGAGALRADLRVAEASLKDTQAQLERLATQAETSEAARVARAGTEAERGVGGGAVAAPSAEMEARVQELQRQVSEELECLRRHQKDLLQAVEEKKQPSGESEQKAKGLPGLPRGEEMERAVSDLSCQVASELQDLQEHQQDLRKVKDLVSSLSSKTSTAEQDIAGGTSPAGDVDRKSLNKLEAIVEDLSKQVSSAALAGEKGTEASEALKQQVQKLQSDHDALASDRIRALEKRLEQLRSDHDELSGTRLLGSDFVDRVSEVMQRLKGGEEKIAAVEKQLEQPIKALDSRLEQLRSDYEALKQTKVLHSDLTGRISEVLQRLASSEEAIAALQRRPGSAGPADDPTGRALKGGDAPAAVEAQIQELQRKVTEELHCLEKHQGDLAAVGSASKGGGAGTGSVLPSSVEEQVQELQRKVAEELRSLDKHQAELAAASSPSRGEGSGGAVSASVEAQIRELQRQVTEELHCLEKHQGDLAMVGPASRGGGAAGQDALPGATDGEDVEQAVAALSKQVAAELRDLRDHQQDLGRVRTAVMALSSQTSPQQLNGHVTSAADVDSQKRPSHQLEKQVEELSKQVSSELQMLTGQQAELGQAKATLGDLAKQVKDVTDGLAKCDSTCVGLRQQLDRCKDSSAAGSQSLPAVGLAGKTAGPAVASAKPSGKNTSTSSGGRGRRRSGSAEGDSDQSDTYGNEFEESIGEESVSEC